MRPLKWTRALWLIAWLAPSMALAFPYSARLLDSAQGSAPSLVSPPETASPPLLSSDAELTPSAGALVDPASLPTGMPFLITGAVMMAGGANALVIGAVYLLGGLATNSLNSPSSSFFTAVGLVFSLGGAAVIGTGAYLFFRGRAQRNAYNEAREARAVEGLSASYDPISRSGHLVYRATF